MADVNFSIRIDHILELLNIQWDWSTSFLKKIVEEQCWELINTSRSGNRRSYLSKSDLRIAAYLKDGILSRIATPLAIREDPEMLKYDEIEKVYDEFHQGLGKYQKAIEDKIGPSEFCGGSSSPGFPRGLLAMYVAYWSNNNGKAYLSLSHQDTDLPIVLEFGIMPEL